jgi:DNA polymerase-1
MGDSVDNIPGVPKCGPKTAAKWINEYGSLDGVIANADKIKGKIGEHLRASLDQLPLSRELTTIKTDVALDFGRGPDPDRAGRREPARLVRAHRVQALLATLNAKAPRSGKAPRCR